MRALSVSQRGFSLLEVLVSVVLLAIGIVALASMQVVTIRGNTQGNETSIAASLLNARMDSVTSLMYYNNMVSRLMFIDPGLSYNGGSAYESTVDQFGKPGGEYLVKYTIVNEVPPGHRNGDPINFEAYKDLRFEVLWNQGADVVAIDNVRMAIRYY